MNLKDLKASEAMQADLYATCQLPPTFILNAYALVPRDMSNLPVFKNFAPCLQRYLLRSLLKSTLISCKINVLLSGAVFSMPWVPNSVAPCKAMSCES